MRIIVDTNRIIAALVRDGLSRTVLSSQNIEFYTIEYVIDEVKKYMDYIVKKSGLTKEDITLLFDLLMENIIILTDHEVKSQMKEATKIMKDVDEKDSPILACALAIPNDGIWTSDKDFDEQTKVKVWKTKELISYI